MASFNKVILLGNLTRNPEQRTTPTGLIICKFSIAVSRTYKGQDGSQKEEVTYVDVDSFGKPAELIARYLTKGSPIFLEGRLRLDQWEKDGEKRSRLTVILENFQFISTKRPEDVSSDRPMAAVGAAIGHDAIDEDVPF